MVFTTLIRSERRSNKIKIAGVLAFKKWVNNADICTVTANVRISYVNDCSYNLFCFCFFMKNRFSFGCLKILWFGSGFNAISVFGTIISKYIIWTSYSFIKIKLKQTLIFFIIETHLKYFTDKVCYLDIILTSILHFNHIHLYRKSIFEVQNYRRIKIC